MHVFAVSGDHWSRLYLATCFLRSSTLARQFLGTFESRVPADVSPTSGSGVSAQNSSKLRCTRIPQEQRHSTARTQVTHPRLSPSNLALRRYAEAKCTVENYRLLNWRWFSTNHSNWSTHILMLKQKRVRLVANKIVWPKHWITNWSTNTSGVSYVWPPITHTFIFQNVM